MIGRSICRAGVDAVPSKGTATLPGRRAAMATALLLVVTQLCIAPARADSVGYRKLHLDEHPDRVLEAALWYPAKSGTPHLQGDNAVFVGQSVIVDGEPDARQRNLVVLSHGYGGNSGNQAWLATGLAHRGYVVAAVNHPGTTSRNRNPVIGAQLWERPRDLTRLIDYLANDTRSGFSPGKIAVIGHSLGGWTAIELVGGRFNPSTFDADCRDNPALAACRVVRELGAGQDASSREKLSQDLRDPRVDAAVSLDLGLARGFDPASLATIGVPVLVVAAGEGDEEIPSEKESGALAAALPPGKVHYRVEPQASHFSFLPLCKPGAAEILEADAPGDGIICLDGGPKVDRAALHNRLIDEIADFLDASLGQP